MLVEEIIKVCSNYDLERPDEVGDKFLRWHFYGATKQKSFHIWIDEQETPCRMEYYLELWNNTTETGFEDDSVVFDLDSITIVLRLYDEL